MKALKWIGIGVGALFALLVIASVVLYFSIRPYLSSESFRKLVEAEVSKQLEVPVQIESLRWTGLTVFTNSIKTSGPSKVAIKSLDVQQLRIGFSLRPLLQRIARVDRIEMQALSVEFQVPEPQPEKEVKPSEPAEPPPQWIQSLAPKKVEIGEIAIQQTQLRWPSGENEYGELSQLKLLATVDGNDLGLDASHGVLRLPKLPELALESLRGRMKEKQIFITTGTLKYRDKGSLTVDGEIGLQTPNTAHLNILVDAMPIDPFLPADWRARLLGNVNGKLKVTQDEKTHHLPQATGSIELTQGKIEALPFLNRIAQATNTERWKSISLDRAQTNFFWSPEKTVLEQIDFESKGLLLLQGTFQVEGEQVTGKTTVATDAGFLKPFPGVLEQVFNQPLNDYMATPVELSGTTSDIQEDLTQRIVMAVASGLLQKLPEGVGEKIQNVTDELKKNAPGIMNLFK